MNHWLKINNGPPIPCDPPKLTAAIDPGTNISTIQPFPSVAMTFEPTPEWRQWLQQITFDAYGPPPDEAWVKSAMLGEWVFIGRAV